MWEEKREKWGEKKRKTIMKYKQTGKDYKNRKWEKLFHPGEQEKSREIIWLEKKWKELRES